MICGFAVPARRVGALAGLPRHLGSVGAQCQHVVGGVGVVGSLEAGSLADSRNGEVTCLSASASGGRRMSSVT